MLQHQSVVIIKKNNIKTYQDLERIQNDIEHISADYCNLKILIELQNELLKFYDIFKKADAIRIDMEYHYNIAEMKIYAIKKSNEYLRSQKLKTLLK